MTSALRDAMSAIQKRNNEITKLKEENEAQIGAIWHALMSMFKSAERLIGQSELSAYKKACAVIGAPYFNERKAHEEYLKLASTIRHVENVLAHYGENAEWGIEDGKAYVSGEWTCYHETDYESACFPEEWLDLGEDGMLALVSKAVEDVEEEAKRNLAVYEQKKEERERQKYEKLKAKYEKAF